MPPWASVSVSFLPPRLLPASSPPARLGARTTAAGLSWARRWCARDGYTPHPPAPRAAPRSDVRPRGAGFVLQTERDIDEQLDHALHDARAARVALQVRGSAGEDRAGDAPAARGRDRAAAAAPTSRELSPLKVCPLRRRPLAPFYFVLLSCPRAAHAVSTAQVRHTHHVSYHRCESAGAVADSAASEDAAAAALAIVERSMRNNQFYAQALKSTLGDDVRAMSNIHFAGGEASAAAARPAACRLAPARACLRARLPRLNAGLRARRRRGRRAGCRAR